MTGISLKLWQNIATRKDLLKYSGLDANAMVKVWEKLREVSKKN